MTFLPAWTWREIKVINWIVQGELVVNAGGFLERKTGYTLFGAEVSHMSWCLQACVSNQKI